MAGNLSQTQIIRSLGQALEWFEKEIGWGVSPGELNHLTGRIGELYAAMVTRGQMALATNQRGYDVVSGDGDYISVKTVTSSNHVTFRESTFDLVSRVMILRLVIDDDDVSIEEVLDCPADDIRRRGANEAGQYIVYINGGIASGAGDLTGHPRKRLQVEELRQLKETGSAIHGPHRIIQFENGTILVETNGQVQPMAKPILREIAKDVGVDILNDAGNKKNTRSLGSDIIRALS
ncbi:hypothetical protein IQ03_04984 [Gemmobacter caeni]|uniref:DUF6998 domain-containing protein n=1 Tax=Gemmobacter caeni TaxID=589035 RepID=A0A2T5ZV89_9RHOB|nr:hypothetical protein [Gemmobacter caeni]PTX35473.1 hypothetical protein C8N34_1791 [Gemmobacter caeni]TWI90020.1 hypothetical protein IQ03_04984 [Gemmobacter caeni]